MVLSVALAASAVAVPNASAQVAPPEATVAADPLLYENQPAVAFSTANPNRVVAAVDTRANRVDVHISSNGGSTWKKLYSLPRPTGYGGASYPTVRATTDGSWFVFAYVVFNWNKGKRMVVTSRLKQDFSKREGPFAVVPATSDILRTPWLDVHQLDASRAQQAYVTVIAQRGLGDCSVRFSRSSTGGRTWSPPAILASSTGCAPYLAGPRPVGGIGGNVLACWYNSEADGQWAGVFDIRCRSSADGGATFGAETAAVDNQSFELPRYLCPSAAYHNPWQAMWPSLAVDPGGRAHLVFTSDPTPGAADGECGDVFTVTSAPPYTVWSAAAPVASGAGFQGFGQVVAQRRAAGGCTVDYAYLDHGVSPLTSPNLLYDVKRRESTDCGTTLLPPVPISARSSVSQFDHIGTHAIDLTATPTRTLAAWVSRSDLAVSAVLDPETDIRSTSWAHR